METTAKGATKLFQNRCGLAAPRQVSGRNWWCTGGAGLCAPPLLFTARRVEPRRLGFAPSFLPCILLALLVSQVVGSRTAFAEPLPENNKIKVVSAGPADCYIYQAQCLRVTVMCKKFIPLGRPILEVAWFGADGKAFYTVVKHVSGTAHCNLGDIIHKYVPWYENKKYTLRLP